MQDMLGVDQPDYGHIFEDMVYKEDEKIDVEKFIKPRIEFEIGFVLKEDIDAEKLTSDNVADYFDYALPAAELIDSRIVDWKIKFEDTVSNNGSSAGAVLGNPLEAVVRLTKSLYGCNIKLKKGEVFLAGFLTKAMDVEAHFENLGAVKVEFKYRKTLVQRD